MCAGSSRKQSAHNSLIHSLSNARSSNPTIWAGPISGGESAQQQTTISKRRLGALIWIKRPRTSGAFGEEACTGTNHGVPAIVYAPVPLDMPEGPLRVGCAG